MSEAGAGDGALSDSRWGRLRERAFRPTSPMSLGFVRLALGAVLCFEVVRYFAAGRIHEYYVDPPFHFTYSGFHWVRPWPGWGMDLHFVFLGLCALGITLGVRYRLALWGFFFGFLYVFLLEATRYLNHFYLLLLVLFLLGFMPAERGLSLVSWRRGRRTIPAWCPFALKALLALVYFYAALAKCNEDWLRGEPLRSWLAARADTVPFGFLLKQAWAPWFFSYGGLIFDLLAGPLLWWKRTRVWMFGFSIFFHATNHLLFSIGIFPAMMLATTTIFFAADWPVRWFGLSNSEPRVAPRPSRGRQNLFVAGLVVFFAVQVLVPLRHFAIPGVVHWTEEGHGFAWHMKLRSKSGTALFHVVRTSTGERTTVDPALELTEWQARKMAARPPLILQYAHHLERRFEAGGRGEVEVYVESLVRLNARAAQPLVDPAIDLTTRRIGWGKADWIVPLNRE